MKRRRNNFKQQVLSGSEAEDTHRVVGSGSEQGRMATYTTVDLDNNGTVCSEIDEVL